MSSKIKKSRRALIVGLTLIVSLTGLIIFNVSKSGDTSVTQAPIIKTFLGDQSFDVETGSLSETEIKSLPKLESVAKDLMPLVLNVKNQDTFLAYSTRIKDSGIANAKAYVYDQEFFIQCSIRNCVHSLMEIVSVPTPSNVIPDEPQSAGVSAWYKAVIKVKSEEGERETTNTWYLFRKKGEAEVSIETIGGRLAQEDGVADGQDSAGVLELPSSNGDDFLAPGFSN